MGAFLCRYLRSHRALATTLMLLPALLGERASAATAPTPSLASRVRRAELIFDGVVASVAYGESTQRAAGDVKLPHTFVTYEVANVYKGRIAEGRTLTLRFIGGPVSKSKILVVSGVPFFDPGNRDLLFVSGNGVSGCPLVECAEGRIRITGDSVYGDDGSELLDRGGAVVSGEMAELKEVGSHTVGTHVLRRRVSRSASEEGIEKGVRPDRAEQAATVRARLTREGYLRLVKELIDAPATAGQAVSPAPVRSVSPHEPFFVRLSPARLASSARRPGEPTDAVPSREKPGPLGASAPNGTLR